MFDRSKCDLCGDCLTKCQYVDYDQERAVKEFSLLIEGKNAPILGQCVTCMACQEYCPTGASPFDLICELQERWEVLPPVPGMTDIENMPSEVVKGDPNKPVLSLCAQEPCLPSGAIGGQMFDGLTVVKGSDYFCYIAYYHFGKPSLTREHAQKFVDNLAGLGANEIIFIHADCWVTLDKKMPEYGIEVPFKVVRIINYLVTYLKNHHGSITKLNKKIAFHRSCVTRYTPEDETTVDELFDLIGVDRVARKHDRETALCCGAGLGYMNIFPEKVENMQRTNLADAVSHGAEAMVFLCPVCLPTLEERCREYGLAPIYITDLCRMALGEMPFPS